MSVKRTPTPKYRRQRIKGRPDKAFAVLDGKRHWLGQYDTPASREKYDQLIAEWLSHGRRLPVAAHQSTVVELAARFWDHAKTYYRRPDGTATSSLAGYRIALRPLKRLYGSTRVADFGPRALKAVRQAMIDKGLSRGVVNQNVNLIRGVFRWGVSQEIVPVEVHTALTTLMALKRGRSEARETEPVKPVLDAHIDAIRPYVSRQVWALIQLQLLTGARGSELVGLRAVDLDTSSAVWTATPTIHKTAHYGHARTIYFGPRAQQIVRDFMADRPVDAPLFSPREAEAERHAKAPTHRRPNQPPTPRQTDRTVGDTYATDSYRRAIERGCKAAGVPIWTPHRLRHNAGTMIRKDFGVEAAQLMLGHARAGVTQVYAEVNAAKAVEVARRIG